MNTPIAIVGMSCVYPDARSPMELWENVLAQRRAFRRMPSERMRLEDYLSSDPKAPDCTYAAQAAVIEGYEFDRVAFRVVGSTYRSADLAHWLALDVASRALADAGFHNGEGLARDTTGVVLGNTLTGEFSRANVLRLRWPYVQRVVDAALIEQGWPDEKRRAFFDDLEIQYKAPFPPVGEETLAGGLSNTIAGRICNQFDLKGGGYTIDGACASSLLAVANACTSLGAGDLDVALAGGVDLSLDPFEIVGFSKTGALAPEEMRIYDTRSAGFWPGEGCGFVVLMRYEEAVAQCRRIYALIRGWGVSSDGSGGITRPEMEGQLQAIRRAYRRAGFGPETVSYFEGHGTGTNVGDATELRVLARARREATPAGPSAVIGSIKANIGHTKAAAGIAGLIKATLAVHSQVLPPTTGCQSPHPELAGDSAALRIAREGECWPLERPLRAGVSAMGFGGINSHLVIEGIASERRTKLSTREHCLIASVQDVELFLLGASSAAELILKVDHLLSFAEKLSRSEIADLAAELEKSMPATELRAALLASTPTELADRLLTLKSRLEKGVTHQLDFEGSIFIGSRTTAPRIGYLFPGQGSPVYLDGGILRRRFQSVRELYGQTRLPVVGDGVATQIAQPALCTGSLAGLRVLSELGLSASLAVGHSLGEITALHWAGVFDEAALLRIARVRGQAMADLGSPTGAMAAIAAPANEVGALLNGDSVSIVGFNSLRQTVVAGEATAVTALADRAQARGFRVTRLAVSHAFHTPLVAAASPVLAQQLSQEHFEAPRHCIVSTITGAVLSSEEDLRALLCRQVTSPVRFIEAVTTAAEKVDLFIEVGPGQVLTGLAGDCVPVPVVALDSGGPSLKGLLQAVGAAYALGASLDHTALFRGRFTRPFVLDWKPKFFTNPCELAPAGRLERRTPFRHETSLSPQTAEKEAGAVAIAHDPAHSGSASPSALDLLRQLVAERAELPVSAISDESRLLGDLHLNSISVGQLVAEAARRLQVPPLLGLTDFANATVGQIAEALEELARQGGSSIADDKKRPPPGVDSWVRPFVINWAPAKLRVPGDPPSAPASLPAHPGDWKVLAPPQHPLAIPLQERLSRAPGSGVVVCLPPSPDETHLGLLLEGAHAALAKNGCRFVIVQQARGAGSFARSLHLEAPQIITCVVDVPFDHPQALEWIAREALAAEGHVDVRYEANGERFEPFLAALPLSESMGDWPLGADDVLLVTGGGKGIAVECALSLARKTGAHLVLLGRSQPFDREVAANLERIRAAAVRCRYFAADVTDAGAVRAALAEAQRELGPVTAFLHAAGLNVPQSISSLDKAAFRRTLAPKIRGARNVLAAISPEHLRLFISFSSIIGRAGLQGEADYAVANEWLTQLTEAWQATHPHCRCLALEWSVWSGVGMGARLGRVESLRQQGITPISPEAGVELLERLLRQPLPAVAVVVTGRFGELPTLKLARPELPFHRFLEQSRVFYPGVELIVDSVLSCDNDPYVEEHIYHGERLFPAVMGLEAMAQAAMALVGSEDPPGFENVEFARPVVVPQDRKLTIRVAALVRQPGTVEVVLRTEETGFQADHFRAVCRFEKGTELLRNSTPNLKSEIANLKSLRVALEPLRDLYGELLFHTGRFQRVLNYRLLRAKECVVQIEPDTKSAWFSRYLPQDRVLGDTGVRDAAIHAIQACIPHARLLPVGVRRVIIGKIPCLIERLRARTGPPPELLLHAREVAREGDTFHYDLELLGEDGTALEKWEGLRLREVEDLARTGPWPEALLGPYLERRLEELLAGAHLAVALERDVSGEDALQRLTGSEAAILRRPDGKPEVAGEQAVSVSHAGGLTLAISGPAPLGCDLQAVAPRSPETWRDLLGPDGFRLAELISEHEDLNFTATRVWTAMECLKKAGAPAGAPLIFDATQSSGWVLLRAGALSVATCLAQLREEPAPIVVSVLARNRE